MAQSPTIPLPTSPAKPIVVDKIDFNNVQGDILFGLPKKHEVFMFFQIRNPDAFRTILAREIVPLITTTAKVQTDRHDITVHKQKKSAGHLPITGVNIAFSHKGLLKLEIYDELNDPNFVGGQFLDAKKLGDPGKQDGSTFDPSWRSEFKETIHGVLLFTGDCMENIRHRMHKVEGAFMIDDTEHAVIVEVLRIKGQPRPGSEKGHEHFGFMDGVSQPAVKGVHPTPLEGEPAAIEPGVILLGRNGDTDKKGNRIKRPEWAKDGSFLVFRQLNQQVPEFDKFLTDHAPKIDGYDLKHRREYLGARLFGRWKSGAPIIGAYIHDDPRLAKNNSFIFPDDQTYCPYAAHIRKTNPRNDLNPEDNPPPVGRSRIIRTGIPFGPEVSPSEAINQTTEHERGLAFTCYQSNIDLGFVRIQERWCNDEKFPKKTPEPGFDPIIGAKNGEKRQMSGVDKKDTTEITIFETDFVIPKGGEYFLSPSIEALKTTLGSL